MNRKAFLLAAVFFFTAGISAALAYEEVVDNDDMAPVRTKRPYRHVLVVGNDYSFSRGSDTHNPQLGYFYFNENHDNPNLYTQLTFATVRLFGIVAYRSNRVFAGIQPQAETFMFSAWRSFNRGYLDRARSINGNDVGINFFFQYNWLRILSTRVYLHPAYYFYIVPVVTPNDYKTVKTPNPHLQVKPGIEVMLSRLSQKDLNRVMHGYVVRFEYSYARRIGYGTWYDYDRLIYRERYNGTWITPPTHGVWYRSDERNTHRLYFNTGAYYNFAGDLNLWADFYGGYFRGVDRNNAEQIGYLQPDHAVMPGYFNAEFFHSFYLIARVQVGFPVPFWGSRLQPGFYVLYMPRHNDVVGVGRKGAVTSPWLAAGYPRRYYRSVSCTFSTKIAEVLPFFADYAYGIDAQRTPSVAKLYLRKWRRGSHEVRGLFVMAFGDNG